MNLQESIEYLVERGVALEQAKAPEVIAAIPGDGSAVQVFVNGQLKEFPVPPKRREHQVDSVSDLIASAKQWNTKPVVWVDSASVVLVIDDGERRDRVTLKLNEGATFKVIRGLQSAPTKEQVSLIRLLRVELRKAAGAETLLATIRKIKFRSSSEGHADIQHGSESLGKAIESQVSGVGEIPELLIVPTNVYCNPGEEQFVFEIGLDLEIDVTNQRFILRPIPDEIERMTAAALHSIYQRISDDLPEVPIFYGRP